jgi:cytochrome b561
MRWRDDETAWGWPTRLLHWAMAGLILFMLGLGVYMTEAVTDVYAQFDLYQTHKSWGFVVFSLAVVRVIWRMASPREPAAPPGTPGWERAAARATHVALYALMFAMPLSGWLTASASELQDLYGIRNMVFGWFEMPDPFVPGSEALEAVFSTIHAWCAAALAGVLVLHAGAALRHHFVRRDDVLRRMSVGR